MNRIDEMIAEAEVYREGWKVADWKLSRKPLHVVITEAFKLVRSVSFNSFVRGFCDRLTEQS